jgi:hypothetical protein
MSERKLLVLAAHNQHENCGYEIMTIGIECSKKAINEGGIIENEPAKPIKPIDVEKLITYANLHGWF